MSGQPASQPSAVAPDRIMTLTEVKSGMKGIARTVFDGTEPEEFNVEIIGVVPGAIGPKQDMIVGRISGGKAERTGVFAGMSGSPVFVDGKLIGAISYSFPFSKEPMCGITPIEQMLSIFEQRVPAKATTESTAFSFAELVSTNWSSFNIPTHPVSGSVDTDAYSNTVLASAAGQTFRPIGTPLTFNGISQAVLDMFAPQLLKAGLVPVASPGGSATIGPMKKADEKTLLGGSSVSMHLTRGDFSIAAAGTVTLRDGDRIYAFGHPFLSLGSSELPMSESSVVTVVPNMNNSFKIAVPHDMVGTMTQDRATGVFGRLGQEPALIPVRVILDTSRGGEELLSFEVVRDSFLTPLLVNIGLVNALIAQERGLGDSVVTVSGDVKLKGTGSIRVNRRFSGAQANAMAAGSIASPLATLFRSGFDGLQIESIEVRLRSIDGSRTATLERISVNKDRVRPGESIEMQAFAMTNTGRMVMQRIPVKIPLGAPTGKMSIVLGDGTVVQRSSPVQHFVPRNLSDLVLTINQVKIPDRLYLQLIRTSQGAIVGSNEMPDLPPSFLATLNSERATGGIRSSVSAILMEMAVPPSEFIITGEQKLTIEVIK
ncbi:SpoIVB peptidase S55 domain-containing protein [Leptolyngbya sp. 7M]|uniref:SpoIVB peptidase S55 domain-containing protein n=1 Tax=Leptolyngbya sp. 7M TaxID=2812896 RepID=UPI001B8B7112|nr:SpoIVB peptidase S55 domain-containing protein [Leptolyngbya sp. 7M]QYO66455.1 hypothetical protein JVX88_06555 [Leptolyngbya sp. 7M]